jgi:hypothetical protein
VAITALNQSDFNAMAIRPGKLRLLCRVAAEAKLSLRLHEHEIHIGGFMCAVTADTTDAAGQVLGLGKILRLQAGLMTAEADPRCLSWAQSVKPNDLGNVTAAVNVRLSRTMTGLASMLIALEKRRVRGSRKCFSQISWWQV